MQSRYDSYDVCHCKLHQSACYSKIQNMLLHWAITLLLVSASEYHITHEFITNVANVLQPYRPLGHHIVYCQVLISLSDTVINKQL